MYLSDQFFLFLGKAVVTLSVAVFPTNGTKHVVHCNAKDTMGTKAPDVFFSDSLRNKYKNSTDGRIYITMSQDKGIYCQYFKTRNNKVVLS